MRRYPFAMLAWSWSCWRGLLKVLVGKGADWQINPASTQEDMASGLLSWDTSGWAKPPRNQDPMKTTAYIAAMGLMSAMMAVDAAAAKPGRPDALTRGIGENRGVPSQSVGEESITVKVGRPEAPTRGLGANLKDPSPAIANSLSLETKPGRPEYHTRGIFCPHRNKRG